MVAVKEVHFYLVGLPRLNVVSNVNSLNWLISRNRIFGAFCFASVGEHVIRPGGCGQRRAGNNKRIGQMLQTHFGVAELFHPALEYFKLTVDTAVRRFRERFDVVFCHSTVLPNPHAFLVVFQN